jgi:ABC-type uncharacterized transport system substrate-binding protein
MRRRSFISLAGCAVVSWTAGANAQSPKRIRRIAFFSGSAENAETRARVAAFREGLVKLGWIEEKNIRIDISYGDSNPKHIEEETTKLIASNPDVVVSGTSVAIGHIMRSAPHIPIVFASITDPVGQGFVDTLARPGRSATGFSGYEPSLGSKWIQTLKEVAPSVRRAAILYEPVTAPYMRSIVRSIIAAGPTFGVALNDAPVHTVGELEDAIATVGKEDNGGLILPPGAFTLSHSELIVALAAKYRLPAVYAIRYFIKLGGLISYGANNADQFGRAAIYVDRILKGAKPADLPVQNPIKFELVINLKTAKLLGLTIPPKLMFTADEVIE